jgi:hypothetical protein
MTAKEVLEKIQAVVDDFSGHLTNDEFVSMCEDAAEWLETAADTRRQETEPEHDEMFEGEPDYT